MEQLWSQLKGRLASRYWYDLEDLQQALSHQLRQLMRASLRSLMQREAIIEALTDAGLVFQVA